MTVVQRPDIKGFLVVPKRCIESSEAWIQLSFVHRFRQLAGKVNTL